MQKSCFQSSLQPVLHVILSLAAISWMFFQPIELKRSRIENWWQTNDKRVKLAYRTISFDVTIGLLARWSALKYARQHRL